MIAKMLNGPYFLNPKKPKSFFNKLLGFLNLIKQLLYYHQPVVLSLRALSHKW